MTRKQLQALITAGVFSTAFLSGLAYAADSQGTSNPSDTSVDVSTPTPKLASDTQGTVKSKDTTSKDTSQHGCMGAGGCGGK